MRMSCCCAIAALILSPSAGAAAPGDAEANRSYDAREVDLAREGWDRVLAEHVDSSGAIDFAALRQDPDDLGRYVSWAAHAGPRSTPTEFPDHGSRLAYYLDTYNALAMWNVVKGRYQPKQKIRFFSLTRLRVDGESRSLRSLENDLIRPLGDPRVHFVLNCMVRGCPKLLRKPWSPEGIDARLDASTRSFLSERRNVESVPARRVVRISSIFRFYPGDFLSEAPSLLAYVNRYRDEPVPEDFEVEFIPYDWTLNQSMPTIAEGAPRSPEPTEVVP